MNPRKPGAAVSSIRPRAGACVRVCRQPLARLRLPSRRPRAVAAGDGIVRVSRESKGRGGKTVTVVRGLALEPAALVALGKSLRAACGAGGTAKDGVLEVQGDHAARVIELLQAQGWTVKRAGG